MKEKMEKLDFIKIKVFCSAKDNVKIMRRQATDREKIHVKDTFDKRLLFIYTTNCYNSIVRKQPD